MVAGLEATHRERFHECCIRPARVEGPVFLFVILSERSESKDPYSCKKSQRSRVAQQ
jgi:hypothetical protein